MCFLRKTIESSANKKGTGPRQDCETYFTIFELYTEIFILLLHHQNEQKKFLNSLSPAVSFLGPWMVSLWETSFIFIQVKGLLAGFLQMKPAKSAKLRNKA